MNNAKEKLFYKVIKTLRKFFSIKKKMNSNYIYSDFTIISSNCIGGIVYHNLRKKFLSPTINLYVETPDFIKFCNNLSDYMSYELIEVKNEKYPMGSLNDIKIHFVHYSSFAEAKECWDRRKQRINYNNIFVILSDRDKFSPDLLKDIEKIPYNKVLYSHVDYKNDFTIFVKRDRKFSSVRTLTDVINLKGDRVFDYYFDIYKWLTGAFSVEECKLK